MNTERSEKFVKEWAQNVNSLRRASITCQRDFKTIPEEFFPLLCPTTEYDWIPNWGGELLHSKSGLAEYNCIFRTSFFGKDEIWCCSRYEPNRAIEFVRFSVDTCEKMEISVTDNFDGTITGKWVLTVSALNENGNNAVIELESGRQDFERLLDTLTYYINNGEMVS